MDGTVIFSKDGILRFRSDSQATVAVPLELIQQAEDTASYPFFLHLLRKRFVLEDGSTMGSFLLCLSPWAEVASALTDRNIQSYIDEIRKPSAEVPVFDRCEVRKKMRMSREMYHEPMPAGVDFFEWMNRPRGETVWLDTYQMEREYDISGYTAGDPSNYSLSTSIHKLKNVPLVVNRQPVLLASVREDQGIGIIHSEAPGVSNHQPEGSNWTVLVAKAVVDEDMTVHDLLQVVVEDGLFFDTPQGGIGMTRWLAARPDAAEEEGLLDDEDTTEDEDEDIESAEDVGMKVSVAPGAFDGIAAHVEREQSEWELLMAKIQPSGRLSYRIGAITEAVPVDDRASGMILK